MFNFFSEIKKELKLPDFAGGYNIVNLNGKAIYVEGHRGILSLSEEIISFRVKDKIVSVLGKGMYLKMFSPNTLSITGEIKCVEVI